MLLYLFPIIAFLFIFLHPTKLLLILADGMPNMSLRLNAGPLVIYFLSPEFENHLSYAALYFCYVMQQSFYLY